MLLAKPAKSNPRAIAQALVDALPANDASPRSRSPARASSISTSHESAWRQQVGEVLAQGARYGRNESGRGHRAGVEYVSANPTGPLHVGHGRAAVIGDCIARVLDANGWAVAREFYYNDAGAQINNLAISVQARAQGKGPDDAGWPEDGYRGDYIKDVAQAYLRGDTRRGRRPHRGRREGSGRSRCDPPVRRRLPAPRAEPRPGRLRRVVRRLLPRILALHRRQGRGNRARADRARPHLRGRRRAVAAHHRFR